MPNTINIVKKQREINIGNIHFGILYKGSESNFGLCIISGERQTEIQAFTLYGVEQLFLADMVRTQICATLFFFVCALAWKIRFNISVLPHLQDWILPTMFPLWGDCNWNLVTQSEYQQFHQISSIFPGISHCTQNFQHNVSKELQAKIKIKMMPMLPKKNLYPFSQRLHV